MTEDAADTRCCGIYKHLELVENLSVAMYVNYTRLFHQRVKTRPLVGGSDSCPVGGEV